MGYRANLSFGKHKKDGKVKYRSAIISGYDYKYPHTALSSVIRSAKREHFKPGMNENMLDKKVRLRVRKVTTRTKPLGTLVKSKTVTWGELLTTPSSKLLK